MAARSAQNAVVAGLNATYHAASGGGDTIPAEDHVLLHIKNDSGVSVTATITTPATVEGLAIADATCVVPAGTERFAGPFKPSTFGNQAGLVDIAWSATASVTFAAVRV